MGFLADVMFFFKSNLRIFYLGLRVKSCLGWGCGFDKVLDHVFRYYSSKVAPLQPLPRSPCRTALSADRFDLFWHLALLAPIGATSSRNLTSLCFWSCLLYSIPKPTQPLPYAGVMFCISAVFYVNKTAFWRSPWYSTLYDAINP